MWAAFSSPSNSWLRLAFCTSVSHGPVRIGHRQAEGFSAVDAENYTIASICPLSNQPSTQKYLFFVIMANMVFWETRNGCSVD